MIKNETVTNDIDIMSFEPQSKLILMNNIGTSNNVKKLPGILFITSYPPRKCGIATYSQDLISELNIKFDQSFNIKICSLESESEKHIYSNEIEYVLDTDYPNAIIRFSKTINEDESIQMVLVQHEFGFFAKKEDKFRYFLKALTKPVVIVFHTVLPNPDEALKLNVKEIANATESIIVMTKTSFKILVKDYGIDAEKITVIPHGTHLVPRLDKNVLKKKYNLSGKEVLSTFGLLSSGKSIETTLNALPGIVAKNPDVIFLIIGKTHPSVVKQEGEKYRQFLKAKVEELHLQQHVKFINHFLPLPELLEYLQLSDIYLFTSKDRNQAVSGTFSYAISCGCPVISTPIPHALEVLQNDAGIIFDFEDSKQLTEDVNKLLKDENTSIRMSTNGLQKMAPTAWENSAIAHAMLFEKITNKQISLQYNLPPVNLDHIKKLTTDFGMIQFSVINQPDINSGYTLDDNARAMVALCQHYELTKDDSDINLITIYLNFIKFCLQPNGNFLNYVDEQKKFTEQNSETNLEDSNGRAIWALGYLISKQNILPNDLITIASAIIESSLANVKQIHSPRAMAFIIKGLYYSNLSTKSNEQQSIIKELANRLIQMYKHQADKEWCWFESYLTYANSILPESLLCAWLITKNPVYKEIAKSSFDFLISKTFKHNSINVISNKTWLHKGKEPAKQANGGEQPIDVAYTILALKKFNGVFKDEGYGDKLKIAFNWFLGANHLHQIVYNPCTGGCYDGLEEFSVNLNQGAESTVSYLMARLTMEKHSSE